MRRCCWWWTTLSGSTRPRWTSSGSSREDWPTTRSRSSSAPGRQSQQTSGRIAKRCIVSPLTARGSESAARSRLPVSPRRGDARAAILAQAGGNPLGLAELTRAVAADPDAAVGWRDRALALTERLRQSFTASALSLSGANPACSPARGGRRQHRAEPEPPQRIAGRARRCLAVRASRRAHRPIRRLGHLLSSADPQRDLPVRLPRGPLRRPSARWPRRCTISPNDRPGTWPRPPPVPDEALAKRLGVDCRGG